MCKCRQYRYVIKLKSLFNFRSAFRTFDLKNLGRIKTVYPKAYTFRQENGLPCFGGRTAGYQLTVEANLEDKQKGFFDLCIFITILILSFPQPCPVVWSRSNRHQWFFVFSSALSRRLESQQSSSMVLCLFLSLVPSSGVAEIVINVSLSFPQPCPVVWSRRNRHQCFFVFSSALSRRLESQKSSSMFLCLFLSLVPPSGVAAIVINVSLSFPQPCPVVWSRSNHHQWFFVFSLALSRHLESQQSSSMVLSFPQPCPVIWSRSNRHQCFFVFSSALSRHLESQQSSSMFLCLFLSLVPSSGVAAIVINVSFPVQTFSGLCPRHPPTLSSVFFFRVVGFLSIVLTGVEINFFPY